VPDELSPLSELCRRATSDDSAHDALSAVTALRERLDGLEREHVAAMLDEGATWAQIAGALGISRQAAHRRFRAVRRARPRRKTSAQVDRVLVTGEARGTVQLAREEAAALGADAVGTEHLLLALIRTARGPVARAMGRAGIDDRRLRTMLQPTLVRGAEKPAARGGLTRHAREVLEGSLREAVERGEGYIAADHLLLALLRNPSGGAAQTLDALGVDPDVIFSAVAARP